MAADPSVRGAATPPDSDPRPASRPTTVAFGGKADKDYLTTEAKHTGGVTFDEQRDGYQRPTVRKAELLPKPPVVTP